MKKYIILLITNAANLCFKLFFNIISKTTLTINSLAAFLSNLYILHEIVSRVVIFLYYIKNIIYFLYVNQKKQLFYKSDLNYYSDLNIFYKITVRPFNYNYLYTLIDYIVINYQDTDVYLRYKFNFVERFYFFISNIFEFDKKNVSIPSKKNKKLEEELNLSNIRNVLIFFTYSFSNKLNKLSYVYSNNLFNLYFFLFLMDLILVDINDFLDLKVREIKEFSNFYINQKTEPLIYSIYIGYFESLLFVSNFIFNVFLLSRIEVALSKLVLAFLQMKENIKFLLLFTTVRLIQNVVLYLYYYFEFYFIVYFIKLFIFLIKNAIYILLKHPILYLSFFSELYQGLSYFLETFYYFITSSFYSEHIFLLLLIEYFLELFGLSINSIEFIISIIFIIISSVISTQFLDFFENYNIELLLETFYLFYFSFSFLYEQQKILIIALNSKLKSYKILKHLIKFSLKFYEINKQNIKALILIEKIKKIKIK